MSPGLLRMAVAVGVVGNVVGTKVQEVIATYDKLLPDLRGLGEDELNELFRFHMRCLVGLGRPGQAPPLDVPAPSTWAPDFGWLFTTAANFAVLVCVLSAVYYFYQKRSEDTLGQFKETKTVYRPPPKVVSIMTKDRREALALIKASSIVSAEEEYSRGNIEDAETTNFYAMQFKLKEQAKDLALRVPRAKLLQRVGRAFIARKALSPVLEVEVPSADVEPSVIEVVTESEATASDTHTEKVDSSETELLVIPPLPVFSRLPHDDYLLDTSRSLNDTYGSILTDPVGGSRDEDDEDIEQFVTPLKTTFRLPDEDEDTISEAFAEHLTPAPVDLVTPKKDSSLQKPQRRFTAASSTKKENTGRRFTTPNTAGRKSSIRRPSILKTPLTARRRSSMAVPRVVDKVEQEEAKSRDKLRFQYLGERHTIEVNFRKGRKRIQDKVVASSSTAPRPHKEYKATFNTFSRLAETSTRSVSMKTRRNKEEKITKKKPAKAKPRSGRVLKCLASTRRESGIEVPDEQPVFMNTCPVLRMEDDDDDDNACFLDGTVTPPVKCNKVELIIPCEPPVLEDEEDEDDDDALTASRRFSVTFSEIAEDSMDFEKIGVIIDQLETPRKRRASTFKPETLAGKVERLLTLTNTPAADIPIHDLELAVASRNVSDIIKHLKLCPKKAAKAALALESGSPYHASPPRHM